MEDIRKFEIRNWFSSVPVVMFVVDISLYDQVRPDDESVNLLDAGTLYRMVAFTSITARKSWETLCHSSDLSRSAFVILCLNKTDLFKQKVGAARVRHYWDVACRLRCHLSPDIFRSLKSSRINLKNPCQLTWKKESLFMTVV